MNLIFIINGRVIVKGSQWEGPKALRFPVFPVKESPSMEQNKGDVRMK